MAQKQVNVNMEIENEPQYAIPKGGDTIYVVASIDTERGKAGSVLTLNTTGWIEFSGGQCIEREAALKEIFLEKEVAIFNNRMAALLHIRQAEEVAANKAHERSAAHMANVVAITKEIAQLL